MAKVLGTFGTNLKGSLGNVTFRVTKDGNIASQKATQVSNPQTENQMAQRCKMNTVVQAYSYLKSIVDHSWEGVVYGAKSMNYFEKLNLERLVATGSNVAFLAKNNKVIAPYDFIVSKGSIGAVFNSYTANGFKLGADCTIGSLKTTYGCELGDQITFLQVNLKTENGGIETVNGVQQNSCELYKCRVTISTKATADMAVFTSTGAFNPDAFSKIEYEGSVNWDSTNGLLTFATPTTITMGTIILSRKSGTTWLRSQSYLKVFGNTKAFQASAAIDTYNPTSPYYLNNAASSSGSISVAQYDLTVKNYGQKEDLTANVTLNYASASAGTTIVVTPNSGYTITYADITAESLVPAEVDYELENGIVTFVMPGDNVEIALTVEQKVSHKVTTSGSGAGQITVSPSSDVEEGTTVTITKPANVSLTSAITVKTSSGTTVEVTTSGSWTSSAVCTGTFSMPSEDVVVTAEYESGGF